MAGLRLTEFDFIDVTVNSDLPKGKSGFKTISFDARCRRVSPDELDEVREAGMSGDRLAIRAFCNSILLSTALLKDFKGNDCNVVARANDDSSDEPVDDGDDPNKEHRETKAAFMATWPLPVDVVTAFIQAQTPKKEVKSTAPRKAFGKN